MKTTGRLGWWWFGTLLLTMAMTWAQSPPYLITARDTGQLYLAEWDADNGGFTTTSLRYLGHAGFGQVRGVAMADFDGDGDQDFVVGGRYSSSNVFALYLNNGANAFPTRRFFVIDNTASSDGWVMDMAAADFNRDGYPDFVAEFNSAHMAVFLGDGKGGFTSSLLRNLGGLGRGTDSGDLNHDGKPDFVRAQASGGEVRVHLGNGDGTFAAPVQIGDAGGDPYGLAVGDFNGDGDPDIIANEGASGNISYWRGNGDGTFAAAVNIAILDINGHGAFAAYDFSGDGWLDFIIHQHYSPYNVYYYQSTGVDGDGLPTFAAALSLGSIGASGMSVAVPLQLPPTASPFAVIDPATQTVAPNGAVALDGGDSLPGVGAIVSHTWDFRNGLAPTVAAGAPGIANPVYLVEGRYRPLLTVTDEGPKTAFATAQVIVEGDAPTVDNTPRVFNESLALNGNWPLLLDPLDYAADDDGVADVAFGFGDGFADGFESGTLGGWKAWSGTWTVSNADPLTGAWSLRQTNVNEDRARVVMPLAVERNTETIRFETDVKMLGGSGEEIILYLAEVASTAGYEIIFRGRGMDDLLIRRITATGGTTDLLNIPLPGPQDPGNVYRLGVELQGPRLTALVNGFPVGLVHDISYRTARFALVTYRTDARFDNVTVTRGRSATIVPTEAFVDDFEDGNADGWTGTTGTWAVANSAPLQGTWSLLQSNASASRTDLLHAGTVYGDFRFEALVKMTGGGGQEVILLTEAVDDNNHYEFMFRGRGINDIQIARVTAGSSTTLLNMPLPKPFTVGPTYLLTVIRRGAFYDVLLDRQWVTSFFDDGLEPGRVGLCTYTTSAWFDQVSLTPGGFQRRFGAGLTEVDVTVTDRAGQSVSDTVDHTMLPGAVPVADHGGPYAVDEFTGNANASFFFATLDGSGSSDAAPTAGIASYAWDLGAETFSGTVIDQRRWQVSAGVTQNDGLSIPGTGAWGQRYFGSRTLYTRTEGLTFEARVYPGSGYNMIGWKNAGSDFTYTQLVYCFYFNSSNLYIYENGSSRGRFDGYSTTGWYWIRIVLKAGGGATYYFKADGEADYRCIYDSAHSTEATLRKAADSNSGTLIVSRIEEVYPGVAPTVVLLGEGVYPVSLAVTDHAGQMSAPVATTITVTANDPPVAAAGPDIQQSESQATDRVWTVGVNGGGSTDDHGIWTYEWDMDYDGATFNPVATSVTANLLYSVPLTHTVALRVTDHAGQTHVDTLTVFLDPGTPPTAVPAGPYAFDEFTGNASQGAWHVTLDGSGSFDNESSIVSYAWDLGADGFTGTTINGNKWAYGLGTTQDGAVTVVHPSTGGSSYYFVAKDTVSRVRGLATETKIRVPASADLAWGFKNSGTDYTWTQWIYGFVFYNGTFRVYESGNSRSGVAGTYVADTWYDVRIELKPGSGARYLYRLTGDSEWTLLYDSAHSSEANLRQGLTVYRGSATIDDVRILAGGVNPTLRVYGAPGTRNLGLTVLDRALNAHTAGTTVNLSVNAPPTVDAGANRTLTEANGVDGTWTFTQVASGSDDHGLLRYDWDWNYDPETGFTPTGEDGNVRTHTYFAPGVYTIAVRVTDHVMQTAMDTATVTIAIGDVPVADPGPAITTEVGWNAILDGSDSTDDIGVTAYVWAFGDGTTGVGRIGRHIYRAVGMYTATLVVYDGAGQASEAATTTVEVVVSTPPTADAGGPYSGGAGGPQVVFNAAGSRDDGDHDVQQGIVQYLWDIDTATDSNGDSDPANDLDLTGIRPFYTYPAAGVYTAKLTVVDGAGQSHSDTCEVTVASGAPPVVVCVPWRGDEALPHPAISGEAVTLKAVVFGSGSFTYQWDFGDGSAPFPATPAAVTNVWAIETNHAYTGTNGKPYTAVLTIWHNGTPYTDDYHVRIEADNLSTRADIAVDKGLWYLHKTQNKTSGVWTQVYGSYYAASVASSLQAFLVNGHRLGGDVREDPYIDTVTRGFTYLFGRLQTYAISAEPAGNPDTNGNGLGVEVTGNDEPYQLGQVMDAFVASQAPATIAWAGPANIKGRSFFDLVTDMVDMYAWGQQDSGGGRGGWRYGWEYGSSDNSAAQWGAIGILAAEENFGINVPQWVKDENRIWLNTSFGNPHFGYDGPNPASGWEWYSVTPSGLVQLAFIDEPHTSARWQAAEGLIATNWPVAGPNSPNYYGLYALTKAMRLAVPTPVTQFRANNYDWYGDPTNGVRAKLVREQDASTGRWSGSAQYNGGYGLGYDLSTAWGITMLTPSLFVQPPVAVITAPSIWGYDLELVLDASNSYHTDVSRSIVKYEWDFNGDGIWDFTTSQPNDPNAVYTWPDPNPGTPGDPPIQATVRLRVTDDNTPAQSDTIEQVITIAEPPHAPYARITGPTTVTQNVLSTFDGSGSFDIDPTDRITYYEWDYDNDGEPDAEGAALTEVSTSWSTVGFVSLGLRVTDNGVLNEGVPLVSEWTYLRIQVLGNLPPVADPGGPYTTWVDEAVTLDGSASSDPNGDPLTFAWDVDGDTVPESTAETLTYTWTSPGTKSVALTVSDSDLSDTQNAMVVVLDTWTLDVQSTPPAGLIVAGSPAGTTPYSARLRDDTAVTLTAPATHAVGDLDYVFDRWTVGGVDQPGGQVTVNFAIDANTLCVATYSVVQRTLTVQSTPVAVAITGSHPGQTTYSLTLDDHTAVSLTAPANVNVAEVGYRFVRWRLNGFARPDGVTTVSFDLEADATAQAEYEVSDRTLTVQSTPFTGLAMTGVPAGITNYAWDLSLGDLVSLTAPATASGELFHWWEEGDGTSIARHPLIEFTVDDDRTIVARYTVKHDDFDDNLQGEMWYHVLYGSGANRMVETNQRLELQTGETAFDEEVEYLSRGWALSTAGDFMFEVVWHLEEVTYGQLYVDVNSPAGDYLGVVVYQDMVSGETMAAFGEATPIVVPAQLAASDAANRFYVSYDASADTLYLSLNGYWRPADEENGDYTWVDTVRAAAGWSADKLLVSLGGFAEIEPAGPGEAWFDDFRVVTGALLALPDVQLDVAASPIAGVTIGVSPAAHGDLLGGAVPFSRTYYEGAAVRLTAPETDGEYAFTHWVVDDDWTSASADLMLYMDGPHAAVAHYTATWMLNVTSAGAAGVPIASTTGHDGVTNYALVLTPGGLVNLQAPAYAGETPARRYFTGWTGDVISANRTLDLMVEGPISVTANYAAATASFSVASQAVGEDAGVVNLTVDLSPALDVAVSVPFSLGGTAAEGDDYTISASPLTIAAGQTQGTIAVTVIDDVADEPDETVIVTLGTPANATLGGNAQHILTILDNDGTIMPPDWQPPTGMANSMVVYAQVQLLPEETMIATEGSLLAAFKDGQCRGVVAVSTGPAGLLYQLQVFSDLANEPGMTYQVWDAATGLTHDIAETLDFVQDSFVGAINAPIVLHAGLRTQTIVLVPGWNWISFNVLPDPPSPANVLGTDRWQDNDVIKGPGGVATFFGGAWYGIDTLEAGYRYLLQVHEADPPALAIEGSAVPLEPLPQVAGWNWLGYTPQTPLPVGEALASLTLSDNDIIKSPDGTATYFGGTWYPNNAAAAEMRPGVGYLLSLAVEGTLSYPGTPEAEAAGAMAAVAAAPGWAAPVGMANSMVVYARVTDGAGFVDAEGSLLAAFKDDVCRGVAAIGAGPVGPTYQLQVFSNLASEPGLTFRVLDAVSGTVREVDAELDFALDAVVGTIADAVSLTSRPAATLGSLQVILEPQAAREAGARWRRLGTDEWLVSGQVETGIAAGSYAVEFLTVDGWRSPTVPEVAVTATAAVITASYLSEEPIDGGGPDNVVYRLTVRGSAYGGAVRPMQGRGFLVLGTATRKVSTVIRWADGTGGIDIWHGDQAMWYTFEAPARHWVLVRGLESLPAVANGLSLDHAYLLGREYPIAVEIGRDSPELVCASFTGEWASCLPGAEPTGFERAALAARIDLARTLQANASDLSHEALTSALAEDLGVAPEPATVPAAAAATEAGIVCYSLNLRGLDAGDGGVVRQRQGGYLLVDLASGQMQAILAWRDATGFWYRVADWTGGETFAYQLGIGNRTYAVYGGREASALSVDTAQSVGFRLVIGQSRERAIGGDLQAVIALALTGTVWDHLSEDGVTGSLGERVFAAALRGRETLAINDAGMDLGEAVDYLIERLPGRYAPWPAD